MLDKLVRHRSELCPAAENSKGRDLDMEKKSYEDGVGG